MGTYNTLEDAMESLASKQAKDTVRGITAENAGKAKRKKRTKALQVCRAEGHKNDQS